MSAISGPWMIRDLGRIRRIAGVLSRHGFADIAARLGFVARVRSIMLVIRHRPPPTRLSVAKRIRIVLEELGPTFVKFGQMLATRPDLVPMAVTEELKRLHDEVAPFDFALVRAIIEDDLKRPFDEIFEMVDPVPIAAASIAQVHHAVLKDGRVAVIKVQRPNLEGVIAADLRILYGIANLLERRVPEIRQFRPRALVEEFRKSLNRETDFRTELSSIIRYKRNFADETGLKVPEPYPEYSGRRVLVMERVDGVKVTNRKRLLEMNLDLKKIIETGMRVTLRSIFEFGFFHADPHPGNFFVQSDGTVVLLDFGMMGTVEPRRIDELLAFMVAVLTGDLDMIVNLMLDADLIGDKTDLRAFRSDLLSIINRYRDEALGAIDVTGFVSEVYSVAVNHGVTPPADLLLIGKAMGTMEGIGVEVVPDFKPLDAVRPYLTEIYVKRLLDTKRHTQLLARSALDSVALLKDAPFEIRRILRQIRRGELAIGIRDNDAEYQAQNRSRNVKRVVLAGLFTTFFFGGIMMVDDDSTLRMIAGLVSSGMSMLFLMGLAITWFIGDGR